jgi:hypothetical protein
MQQEPESSFEARLPPLICTAKPVDKHEGNDDLPTNPSRLPIGYRDSRSFPTTRTSPSRRVKDWSPSLHLDRTALRG